MRLRRSSPGSAGLTRRRFGRGFAYFDARGARIDDPDVLDRISALAIPPAWNQVWICADPQGHIQATGTDAAGRRQYVYHQQWSRRREAKKQQRILELAAALPGARRRSRAALRQQGLTRGRVLAGAFRMLDIESFRVGSDAYANENGTYGLATLQRRHVSIAGDLITFTYVAKGGKRRVESIRDATLARLVGELLDRADRARRLLAWCDDGRWHQVTSGDINDEVRELTHGDFTAKGLPHLERHGPDGPAAGAGSR